MMPSRILLIDIETAPALSYHWGMYDQCIGTNQVKDDWYMLCYAANWLDEKKIMFDAIWKYKKYFKENPKSDLKIAESIHDLMEQADIIVAHNGDDFDVKKINTSFIKNRIPPVKPFMTIDTKKESKKNFGFMSNKLDHILRRLGIGQKMVHVGFDMWTGAMAGDEKYCNMMEKYNIIDVRELKKAFLIMRPYMKHYPDTNLKDGDLSHKKCPKCNSSKTIKQGTKCNKLRRYQMMKCSDCLSWWSITLK